MAGRSVEDRKVRGAKMTDIQNDNKKSKERINNGIYSIHPVENGCSSANVLRPNFGGTMKHADTNTAFTHARDARQTANLRNVADSQSEKKVIYPIFCAKCSALELERLDGIHLCTPCLVDVVARHPSEEIAKIRPLQLCLREVRKRTPIEGE